jgi:hypothetical protein
MAYSHPENLKDLKCLLFFFSTVEHFVSESGAPVGYAVDVQQAHTHGTAIEYADLFRLHTCRVHTTRLRHTVNTSMYSPSALSTSEPRE